MTLALALVAASVAAPLNFTDESASRVFTSTVQNGGLDKEFALGDVDNDGDLDVVLGIADGIFGRRQNLFYFNENGALQERSDLVPNFNIDTLSRRPFLVDIDSDGWLDLIVVNDELAPGYAGETHLWMNSHPNGVFDGFIQDDARLNGAGGDSCGASMADFDQDGDVDLYSGNYPGAAQDTYYLNDGNGNFIDVTQSMVPVDSDYTTDVVAADLNGDGTLDVSVGNHFNPSKISYNGLTGGASGIGDFTRGNSVQVTRNSTQYHNATQPIDVDNDGDLDLYMANWDVAVDAMYINEGNDASGRVIWSEIALPGYQSTVETTKPETFDLDNDGRMDLLIPSYERATILRNMSMDGSMEWIDWTPPAIADTDMTAFSASIFDLNTDGVQDIVLWGHEVEHALIGSEVTATPISGTSMPSTANGPIMLEGGGIVGEQVLQLASGATDYLGAIVRSCGDVRLMIGDAQGTRIRANRSGAANEEYASMDPQGQYGVAVTILSACADSDGDGDVDNIDLAAAGRCFNNPTPSCVQTFDADLDGELTLADRDIVLADSRGDGVPAYSRFTLEVLTRTP